MSVDAELRQLRAGRGGRSSTDRSAYGFLAPWIIGLVVITAGPIIASLVLSFTDYNLLQDPSWIGLDNFRQMLSDERLHHSLRVTVTYVVLGVPLQLGLALAIAVLLNRGMRGLALYRSVLYLPSLLGGSVAVAILWRQIFGTEGMINRALSYVGIDGIGWISDPRTALYSIIALHVWTFGAPMVIFLAGLRQIPTTYYEAASVDGAGRWHSFRHITLPLLTPIIFFNVVLQIISAFQAFTQAFIISGGTGGPSDSTLFYTLYLYEKGFGQLDMGYAAALAWLLLVIIAVFTAINFYVAKFWVFYDN
ncbi:carbohydrate ABC transporter permease [Jiangella asiatica]|uniref:Sugar ABC transporter permease n=1 Tax=Jiangella asiatica TaxID=2530372 RepID=A0A4R5CF83_9ACTN|nr:sugar ABC transporter permease [Jiangella asiatica]TDD95884.1 sugar ABC transporter permease [Jiangella asiatica]